LSRVAARPRPAAPPSLTCHHLRSHDIGDDEIEGEPPDLGVVHDAEMRRAEDGVYRAKDTALVQAVLLRLFSLGRVVITTNDASTPVLTIEAVPDAGRLREDIRKCVEARRDLRRVRLAELE
jgi:hypothetical protein